jgi:hypothetical protein
VHAPLDYASLLKPDPELRELLCSIDVPKYIFTNADAKHMDVCLGILGIRDCFQVRGAALPASPGSRPARQPGAGRARLPARRWRARPWINAPASPLPSPPSPPPCLPADLPACLPGPPPAGLLLL